MKKNIILVISLIILIALAIFVFFFMNKDETKKEGPSEENKIIEKQQKRDPNVTIGDIKTVLSQKLSIKPEEVLIPYYMELSDYMTGGVNHDSEERHFAATYNKEQKIWTIVYEGKDMIPCKVLEDNNFPNQMRKNCLK